MGCAMRLTRSRTKHRLNTKDDSHQHQGGKGTQVADGRVRGEGTLGSLGTLLRDATHVKACSP